MRGSSPQQASGYGVADDLDVEAIEDDGGSGEGDDRFLIAGPWAGVEQDAEVGVGGGEVWHAYSLMEVRTDCAQA